jgi:16S rRNA (cytosine967-C5)-methyltransferase
VNPAGRNRPVRPNEPVKEPDPPGLAARILAANSVAEIATGRYTLDERFSPESLALRAPGLDGRDRALARSIATVSFRRFGSIRAALARFLERGLPRRAAGLEWILLTAAAQILYLEAPDHAAVDLAVRMVRRDQKTAPFAALANAVLRNLARHREELLEPPEPFADAPAWLAARWRKNLGEEAALAIVRAHRMEPTLDLTVRQAPEDWAARLGALVLPTGSVRLESHSAIAELPGYVEGAWWVQDAAAALPAPLLRAQPGERVADLCAAPGGKAAQLAATGARVVAVDKSAERLKRLAANLARLQLDASVEVADALGYSADPFDAVLLDAPCSATGTIRRHPDVAWTKRLADVATLAAMQAKMLDRAAALVRSGGRLVYCVCSLEPEEGAAQITALLRRNPDLERWPVEPEEIGGLSECLTEKGELRTLPCHLPDENPRRSGLDGFFAARLRKRRQG